MEVADVRCGELRKEIGKPESKKLERYLIQLSGDSIWAVVLQ
jgi:hypothetical protein